MRKAETVNIRCVHTHPFLGKDNPKFMEYGIRYFGAK